MCQLHAYLCLRGLCLQSRHSVRMDSLDTTLLYTRNTIKHLYGLNLRGVDVNIGSGIERLGDGSSVCEETPVGPSLRAGSTGDAHGELNLL